MPIYEFTKDAIIPIDKTSFAAEGLKERFDLQRLLRANIEVIAPDCMVLAEEFNAFYGANRSIDLLALDRRANLVVIELKRSEDGGHMELQALRYAAFVSSMQFEEAVEAHRIYLERIGQDADEAERRIREFLDWESADASGFAQDVRIILASADFASELASTVDWLNGRGLDITCMRLRPHALDGRVLVDVQQILPPPETAYYQVKVRAKEQREREARTRGTRDNRRYDLVLGDGKTRTGLPKRAVIYECFHYLVNRGVAPQEIATHCGPRAGRAVVGVDGLVGAEDFKRLADAQKKKNKGKPFDPIRYFCAEGQLAQFDGATYAVSNQWGAEAWQAAIDGLSAAYPEHIQGCEQIVA